MRNRILCDLLLFATAFLGAQTAMSGQAPTSPASAAPQAANTDTDPLIYDAVSIKPTSAGSALTSQMVNGETILSSPSMMRLTADGFIAKNTNAKRLIGSAYSIKDDLIAGAPDWAGNIGYDIQAKITGLDQPNSPQLTRDQRNRMLQQLLAERFKLAIHYETRESPVYEIVIAKGGPNLHEAAPRDSKVPDSASHPGTIMFVGIGQYTAQAVPISGLADFLSAALHRPVVDKTGLTGKYDFTLHYTPAGGPATDAAGPTIFTALQEQLGLKLESSRAPVKSLVIDHIEKPSGN